MNKKNIEHYFDWAATSPADEDILRAALEDTIATWGNPSSMHTLGKKAKNMLEQARASCAYSLGVSPETIFFTSGGTESNHIPLLSILNRPQKGTILISTIEHPSVMQQAQELTKCGWQVTQIPATADGIITPEAVLAKLTNDTVLVCVMAVNNETGAIQPIYEIADALSQAAGTRRRAKLHVDCVQAAGKIPLTISYAGIDSAAFSAHKICGPRGIGIVYLADSIAPFLRGGGQENGIRSGTENLFGACAFAKCLSRYYINGKNTDAYSDFMEQHNSSAMSRFELQKKLTKSFIEKLAAIQSCAIIPEARTERMHEDKYSPWIVQAAFKNIPGQVMLRALDAEGFAISTGSACSSRKNNRPVLEAMHVPTALQENAVRFSFGPHTTEQAMQELVEKITQIVKTFT